MLLIVPSPVVLAYYLNLTLPNYGGAMQIWGIAMRELNVFPSIDLLATVSEGILFFKIGDHLVVQYG